MHVNASIGTAIPINAPMLCLLGLFVFGMFRVPCCMFDMGLFWFLGFVALKTQFNAAGKCLLGFAIFCSCFSAIIHFLSLVLNLILFN